MKMAHENSMPRPQRLAVCVTLACSAGIASAGNAATRVVANCNDSGSGSLREAVFIAQSGDTIDLTRLTCSTISLTTGELLVRVNDLTLQGPGANALTIDGSQMDRHAYAAIEHIGKGTLRIDALRVTDSTATYEFSPNPRACISSYFGAVNLTRSIVTQCSQGGVSSANGFYARDSTISNSYQGVQTLDGNVSINNSTISGNHGSNRCVGLRIGRFETSATTTGTVLISNSTISGNYATSSPGYAGYGAAGCIFRSATISNSTVAFNNASGVHAGLGGLLILAPRATIESSIFAKNGGGDLSTQVAAQISGRNNLVMEANASVPADTITADPMLLPLANNGGPTWTHALSPGSPAIDAGNNSAVLATDQRGTGYARVAGLRADIGAFEVQGGPTANIAIGPGITGAWYDPNQSGHGLSLEVLPNNVMLAYWFTFAPDGQQAWFGGTGPITGTTAVVTTALPTGGRWIPNFDPNQIVRNPWGTLTFTFSDCNHGRVDFSSSIGGYGAGHMDLARLTQPAGLTCP